MRVAEVIGTVTLNRIHPSLRGATLRVVEPLSLDNLTGRSDERADPIVVFDELASGLGDKIAMTEGGEAAQPFYPNAVPVDAYNCAILDSLNIQDD